MAAQLYRKSFCGATFFTALKVDISLNGITAENVNQMIQPNHWNKDDNKVPGLDDICRKPLKVAVKLDLICFVKPSMNAIKEKFYQSDGKTQNLASYHPIYVRTISLLNELNAAKCYVFALNVKNAFNSVM